MPYELRYTKSYQTHTGDTNTLEIYDGNGWGAAVVELPPMNPPMIRYNGTSNKEAGVIGVELEMEFLSSSQYNADTFFDPNPRRYKVVLKNSTTTFFVGWMQGDLSQDLYAQETRLFRVSAIDGLADLKDKKFDTPDWVFLNRTSVLDVLIKALALSGLEINVITCFNAHDEHMTQESNALGQAYIDPKIWINDSEIASVREVLDALCESFYCRLYQRNGAWYFVGVDEQAGATSTAYKYSHTGQQDLGFSAWSHGLTISSNPATTTTQAQLNQKVVFYEDYSQINRIRPVKRLEVNYDYGKNKSSINGEFLGGSTTGWTFRGGVTNSVVNIGEGGVLKGLRLADPMPPITGTAQYPGPVVQLAAVPLHLITKAPDPSIIAPNGAFYEEKVATTFVAVKKDEVVEVSFDYLAPESPNIKVGVIFVYKDYGANAITTANLYDNTFSAGGKLIQIGRESLLDTGDWTSHQPFAGGKIMPVIVHSNLTKDAQGVPQVNTSWAKFSVSSSIGVPADGWIVLYLFRPYSSGAQYPATSITFRNIELNLSEYKNVESGNRAILINETLQYGEQDKKLSVQIGNSINTYHYSYLTRPNGNDPTRKWAKPLLLPVSTLQVLVGVMYLRQHSTYSYVVDGKLRGNDITIGSSVVFESGLVNRRFVVSNITTDTQANTHDAVLVEVLSGELDAAYFEKTDLGLVRIRLDSFGNPYVPMVGQGGGGGGNNTWPNSDNAYTDLGVINTPVDFLTSFAKNGSYQIDLEDWDTSQNAPVFCQSKGHLQTWVGGNSILHRYTDNQGNAATINNNGGTETPLFNADGSMQTDGNGNVLTRITEEGEFPAFWTPLPSIASTEFDNDGNQLVPLLDIEQGQTAKVEFRKIFRGAEAKGVFPFATVEEGIPQLDETLPVAVQSGIAVWDVADWGAIENRPNGWTGRGLLTISYFNGNTEFLAYNESTGRNAYCIKIGNNPRTEWLDVAQTYYNKQEIHNLLINYATADHVHPDYVSLEVLARALATKQGIDWRPNWEEVGGLGYELDRKLNVATLTGDDAFVLGIEDNQPQLFDLMNPEISIRILPKAKEGVAYSFTIPATSITWPNNAKSKSVSFVKSKDWLTVTYSEGAGITLSGTPTDSEDVMLVAVMAWKRTTNAKTTTVDRVLSMEVTPTATTIPVPTAPATLFATAVSNTRINLNWPNATDAGAYYELSRRPSGGTWAVIQTLNFDTLSFADTNLTKNTAYEYRIRAVQSASNASAYATATATTQNTDDTGGFHADYFNGILLDEDANTSVFSRIDPTLNFAWAGAAPIQGVGGANFSVRWSAYIIPSVTGAIPFRVRTNDGIRVWVNEGNTVDEWKERAASNLQWTTQAIENQRIEIVVEYFSKTASSEAKLEWNIGAGFVVVPQSVLIPNPAARIGAPVLSVTALSLTEARLSWTFSEGGAQRFEIYGAANSPTTLPFIESVTGNVFEKTYTFDVGLTLYFRVRAQKAGRFGGFSSVVSVKLESTDAPNAPTPIILERIASDKIRLQIPDANAQSGELVEVQYGVRNEAGVWLPLSSRNNQPIVGQANDAPAYLSYTTPTIDFTLQDALFLQSPIQARARVVLSGQTSAWSNVAYESAQAGRIVDRTKVRHIPFVLYYMDFSSFATERIRGIVEELKKTKASNVGIAFSWFKVWTNPSADVVANPPVFDPTNITQIVSILTESGLDIAIRLDAGFNDFTLANAGPTTSSTLKNAWANDLYLNGDGSVIGLKFDNPHSQPWKLYRAFVSWFCNQFRTHYDSGKFVLTTAGYNDTQEMQPSQYAAINNNQSDAALFSLIDNIAACNLLTIDAMGAAGRFGYGGFNGDILINQGTILDDISIRTGSVGYWYLANQFRGLQCNHDDRWSFEQLNAVETCQYSLMYALSKKQGIPVSEYYFGVEYAFMREFGSNPLAVVSRAQNSINNGVYYINYLCNSAAEVQANINPLFARLDELGLLTNKPRQYPDINLQIETVPTIESVRQHGGIFDLSSERSSIVEQVTDLKAATGKIPYMVIKKGNEGIEACGFGQDDWLLLSIAHRSGSVYDLTFNANKVAVMNWEVWKNNIKVTSGTVQPTSGTVQIDLVDVREDGVEHIIRATSTSCRGKSNDLRFVTVHNETNILSAPNYPLLYRTGSNQLTSQVPNVNAGSEQIMLQFREQGTTQWLTFSADNSLQVSNANPKLYTDPLDVGGYFSIVESLAAFSGKTYQMRARVKRGEVLSAWSEAATEQSIVSPSTVNLVNDVESISDHETVRLRVKLGAWGSVTNGTALRMYLTEVGGSSKINEAINITYNGTFGELQFNTHTYNGSDDIRGRKFDIKAERMDGTGGMFSITYTIPKMVCYEYTPNYSDPHPADRRAWTRLTKAFDATVFVVDWIGDNEGRTPIFWVNGGVAVGACDVMPNTGFVTEEKYHLVIQFHPTTNDDTWNIGENKAHAELFFWIQSRPWVEMGNKTQGLWQNEKAVGVPLAFQGQPITAAFPVVKSTVINRAFENIYTGILPSQMEAVGWSTNSADNVEWIYSHEIGLIVVTMTNPATGATLTPIDGNYVKWYNDGNWALMEQLASRLISRAQQKGVGIVITDWEPGPETRLLFGWTWTNYNNAAAIKWLQERITSTSGIKYLDHFTSKEFSWGGKTFSVISANGDFQSFNSDDNARQYNATHWEGVFANIDSVALPLPNIIHLSLVGYNVPTVSLDRSYARPAKTREYLAPYILYAMSIVSLYTRKSATCEIWGLTWPIEDQSGRNRNRNRRYRPEEGKGWFRGNNTGHIYDLPTMTSFYLWCQMMPTVRTIHLWSVPESTDPRTTAFYSNIGGGQAIMGDLRHEYEGGGDYPFLPQLPTEYVGHEAVIVNALIEARREWAALTEVCDGTHLVHYGVSVEWRVGTSGTWTTIPAYNNGENAVMAWKHLQPLVYFFHNTTRNKYAFWAKHLFTTHNTTIQIRFNVGGIGQRTYTLNGNKHLAQIVV